MTEKASNGKWVHLVKGDITDLEAEAIVYYARPDLKLGTGFGAAIALRGGSAIQEELNGNGPLEVGQAITTTGGTLKAKHIIHAVGPRFHEEDEEAKLQQTMGSALEEAKRQGIKKIAFPAMGSGFYGVSLDLCSRVMLDSIRKWREGDGSSVDIIICLNDNREFKHFQNRLASLDQ